MKEYKTTHRLYSAWNYQREIDDLNAQSEKGWQLVTVEELAAARGVTLEAGKVYRHFPK